MSDKKAILHPQNPRLGINSLEDFMFSLREIGLITNEYRDEGDTRPYHVGDRILEFIDIDRESYLADYNSNIHNITHGISEEDHVKAQLRLTYEVEIHNYGETVTLHGANGVGYQNTEIECRHCQNKYHINTPSFDKALSEWFDNKEQAYWICDHCSYKWHIYDLDWGDAFCFARCAIDLWAGFPSQKLLDLLEQKTGGSWTYFYYHS